MPVDVLLDDSDDGDSYGRRCLSWVALEVLLDFSNNIDNFPWLTSSWRVPPWLGDSIPVDDLGNFAIALHNPCGRSDDSSRHVVEEVLDNVWEVVFWRIFSVSIDVPSDNLDDGHSNRRR